MPYQDPDAKSDWERRNRRRSNLSPEALAARREHDRRRKANPVEKAKGAAWKRERRALHPERYFDQQIRSTYGITLVDYEAMLIFQGGRCAICWRSPPTPKGRRKRLLVIDHCHETGVVRGLICDRCNILLAGIEDDAWAFRAREYLVHYGLGR